MEADFVKALERLVIARHESGELPLFSVSYLYQVGYMSYEEYENYVRNSNRPPKLSIAETYGELDLVEWGDRQQHIEDLNRQIEGEKILNELTFGL